MCGLIVIKCLFVNIRSCMNINSFLWTLIIKILKIKYLTFLVIQGKKNTGCKKKKKVLHRRIPPITEESFLWKQNSNFLIASKPSLIFFVCPQDFLNITASVEKTEMPRQILIFWSSCLGFPSSWDTSQDKINEPQNSHDLTHKCLFFCHVLHLIWNRKGFYKRIGIWGLDLTNTDRWIQDCWGRRWHYWGSWSSS